ncbi:MAG: HPF/RaiA family ribosome-associated protein [Pseudomonadales bacterium]|jgi:ribosomal subunit interface protein|nr:HPF/RaiA family ribosome-associated protein [Pseudomonadales bacterium]
MISDTQVLFRGIDHSAAVEEAVHKRVAKLERFSDEIQSLRVILEAPHNNHHKGKVYHVGVEALIPNHDIVITHDQHDKHSHEDIYVAVRDAFNALERRLKSVYEKLEKQRRQNGKRPDDEPMLMGDALSE